MTVGLAMRIRVQNRLFRAFGHWLPCLAMAAAGVIETGCSTPYAASDAAGGDETRHKRVLDARDQAAVRRAFRASADGYLQVAPPHPAAHGVRWSDVPAAVAAACEDTEMAVVRTVESQAGSALEFQLRTVEDWPATLWVRRTDDDRRYEARAVVGLFGDRHDRAQALIEAFDRRLRAYGRKRGFRD